MFCFANFLLAKGIYGPGKYIFGVFDNSEIDGTYKVIYNVEDWTFLIKNDELLTHSFDST